MSLALIEKFNIFHKPHFPSISSKRPLFFSLFLSIIMMLLINQLYVKGFHPHSSKLFVKNSLSLLSRPSSRIARIRGQNYENPEIDNVPKNNMESHPLFEKAASNFRLLGVTDELISGLCDQSITVPTPVQKEVIPRILQKQNIVMAASTGSGKTLAYVLPAMQHLQTEEQFGYQRLPQRPRCLILVPTRELATQVLKTVKELSHHYKVSSAAVMGGETYSLQRKSLDRLVDIVVASPGRLLQHKEKGNLFLSQVNYIVIDEVDTMLTQGFGSDIRAILRSTMLRKDIFRPQTQVIMATATLTKAVKSLLSDVEGNKFDIEFSDPENKTPKKLSPRATLEMKIIEVDGVHRTLPHVKHIFEETKGMDKLIVLKSLLERSSNKVQDGGMGRTLIFCNTISSCRAVEYAVNEYNTALAYHGDMPSDERSNNLLKFRNGEVNILIGTDIAARGLDIPEIDHVILFDFPMNSVDYIHRAGRCGRAGRKGTVTSIVTKRDQILAGAIQAATEKGLPIDSLSASKKDYKPEGKLSHILRKARATKTSSTAPLKKTSSSVGVPTETRPAKKKEERITPLVIRSRRLEFKKKQQELVKENYKFMKNTVAKGRRGRITKKNPVLVPQKLKSRLSRPKKGELEGGRSSEGREGSKGSRGGSRPSARGGARQGRPSTMSKRR